MAVRGKWPVHPWARLLVRVALDHALPDSTDGMVCSEVVYRAYAECAAAPPGRAPDSRRMPSTIGYQRRGANTGAVTGFQRGSSF